MRFLTGAICRCGHYFLILVFVIGFLFFRHIFTPCLHSLPRPVMVFGAQSFVKFIIWWETYWAEFYLYNNRSYWENIKSIKRNNLCPATTLSTYEYLFARPELW